MRQQLILTLLVAGCIGCRSVGIAGPHGPVHPIPSDPIPSDRIPSDPIPATQRKFAVSAAGPGAGNHAAAIGGGISHIISRDAGGVSLGYAYGMTSSLDFVVSTDLALTYQQGRVVAGHIDPGFRFRFTRAGGYDVGVQLGPELVFVAGSKSAFLFGAIPGLVVGGGSRTTRWSLYLDLPLHVVSHGSAGTSTGLRVVMRVTATVEGALVASLKWFLKVEGEFVKGSGTPFGLASAGISF